MSFYDIVSSILTVLGHVVLIYRIVYELESKNKKVMKEKLCTKWVIFTIFLKIQYWILAVMQILPLGALALLVIKLLLFLPQNPISHKIYKTIQKRLDRIKMDQYHSQLGVYISFVCKHAVILMFRGIKKIAEYVNSNDIEEAENHILDLIKIFQYKKAAVHMRSQAFRSQINKELNDTEFNISQSEDEIIPNLNAEKKHGKSVIGNQMSKILADLEEDDGSTLKITADVMIVKPNKALGQKARYQESTLQFYSQTKKLTITNKNKAEQNGTLKTIKWITKDMIHIEVIFQQGRSKIIKLKEKSDVAKWVEPVCEMIEELQK